jgi:hypothetical protein
VSDSTPPAVSADYPRSWIDPESTEPYTTEEYDRFNDVLYDATEGNNTALRYAATDMLIGLSVIAQSAPNGAGITSTHVKLARETCRRARRAFLMHQTREDAV